MPGHQQQVRGENRCPGIGLEGFVAIPVTTTPTKAALKKRDHSFDPGAKVAHALVDLGALGHLADGEAALFLEGHVANAESFDRLQVLLGGEASVEGRLERDTVVDRLVPLHHVHREGRVGRVALEDEQVGEQAGVSTGEHDFVAVTGFPAILDDDVGVGFEDRDDLLRGGDVLILHDAALCLMDDLFCKACIVRKLFGEPPSLAEIGCIRLFPGRRKNPGSLLGVFHGQRRDREQIPVELDSFLLALLFARRLWLTKGKSTSKFSRASFMILASTCTPS